MYGSFSKTNELDADQCYGEELKEVYVGVTSSI